MHIMPPHFLIDRKIEEHIVCFMQIECTVSRDKNGQFQRSALDLSYSKF